MNLVPSLETVYNVLRKLFPNDFRVIIKCIAEVVVLPEDNKELNTLAIDMDGTLYISQKFWKENIESENDLAAFLLHELMHQITNDTKFMHKIAKDDPERKIKHLAANIAMDARINAYISRYSGIKDARDTFRKLYTKEMIEANPLHALLAAGNESKLPTDMMKGIYNFLYSVDNKKGDIFGFHDLYDEVLDWLRQNKQPEITILIGDHSEEGKDGEGIKFEELPQEVKEAITDYVKEHGKDLSGGKAAGNNNALAEQIIDAAIGIDQAVNLEYFKKLAFDSLMNNVRLVMLSETTEKTKDLFIPPKLSRADLFKLMLGQIPISWDIFAVRPVKSKMKVPIYLDVSGSMHSYLPTLIELILNIRDDIEYVWGFSNRVHKHTMEDLRKRKITSTGGTDFDCIISHAEENNFKSILVITDGYAYCRQPEGEKLPFLSDAVVVLCTESRNSENYFCKTYKNTVQIEEVLI